VSLEAIARATELRPNLVIMDYTMPHVNGLEATGKIHRFARAPGVLPSTFCEKVLGFAI